MLKSNEVRIGNDVLYMDTDTPEFVRVKIDKADIMLLCEGIQGYNYKGVPLTPEILVQCGWVWNEECNSFEKYPNGDARMNLVKNEITGSFEMFNYVLKAIITKRIYHLHQLQNLYYSLVGSELEVAW